MKRIVLIAFMMILFIGTSNAQNQINWLKITDVENQIKADGKDAKRVFIDCYTDGVREWIKILSQTQQLPN